MKAVRREAGRLHAESREIARLACEHADTLRQRRITPAELDNMQSGVRRNLLFLEDRATTLGQRKKTRTRRIKRRFGACPGFGEAIDAHIGALRQRDAELELQRNLLRQAADTLAWLALDREPDVIAPLYAAAPHRLPREIGLVGVVIVAREAHRTGKWLVVETDLTRCLGVGDLVAVPFGRRWSRPLVLEVKTTGEYHEDGVADITVHSVVLEGGVDASLLAEFNESIGLRHSDGTSLAATHPAQAERLEEHVKVLHAITRFAIRRLRAPDDARWSRLTRVVAGSLKNGSDILVNDDGVAYVAMRRLVGDDASTTLQETFARLLAYGYEQGQAEYISSCDFQLEDAGDAASVVPPIALWELSVDHRVALLMREVDLSVVVQPTVWRDAFVAQGVDFDERKGAWLVSVDGREAVFPAFVAAKLHNALLIGISPGEIARGAVEALRRDASGEADCAGS